MKQIKIQSKILRPYGEHSQFFIGTHNGIFHCDEIVACAMLCILHSEKSICILRSRHQSDLSRCDICVDVGEGRFDHHQAGFNLKRQNGVLYASAGLVWHEFGNAIIEKLLAEMFPDMHLSDANMCKIYDKIDGLICLVDCEDNGIFKNQHMFSFIKSFLPLWNSLEPNFNKAFYKALLISIELLRKQLLKLISDEAAEPFIQFRLEHGDYLTSGILELPSQLIPWVETLIEKNDTNLAKTPINFVIFPYPTGGWPAQCVPPSKDNEYGQRIPFPAEWAGKTTELPRVSGVRDALFCHNGRFFVRACSRDGVLDLCSIAAKRWNV